MRKTIILLLMLGLGFTVNSNSQQVSSAEYFINTDPGPGNGLNIPVAAGGSIDESFSFSTSGLPQGNNTLYVRTRGDDGLWSLAQHIPFFLQDTVPDIPNIETRSIVAAEYFIDEDPGTGQGIAIPVEKLTGIEGTFSISTNGLAPGAHSVHVRTLDNKGLWSLALKRQFAVMPSDLDYPVPHFTHDTVDAGVAMTFTNLSDSVNANTVYEWDIMNDGSVEYTDENITHTFDSTGIFQVKLTVSNDTLSAFYIGNVNVGDFENTMLTADGPLEICEGEMVTLTAPVGYSYEWNTGDTSQLIMVGTTGTYYAWLTDTNGLTVKSETLSIDVTPEFEPVVNTQDASNGLNNGFAEVLLMQNTANFTIDNYNFQWSNGDTSNFVSDLAAGDYTVTVSRKACAHELGFTIGSASINTETTSATDIIAAEYFFNSDPGAGNGNALNVSYGEKVSFQESVSLDGLPAGNHKVYIRTKGNNGLWSLAQSMDIYVQDTTSIQVTESDRFIVVAEYFVDTDPGVGNGTIIPVSNPTQLLTDQIEINAADYSSGEHTLYVRTLDDSGQWSIASSTPFQVCGLLPNPPSISDQSVCSGSGITLEALGTSGNTYRWFTSDSSLIENETGATYNAGMLHENSTFYVAQVDAAGCQSQLSEVNVSLQNLDVFAGIDETLSKAGPDYMLNSFYPAEGLWSGSNLDEAGLLTRNNLNEGTYEMTYTVDSAGCSFTDTKEIAILDLSETFEITIEENPAQGLILADAELSDIMQYVVVDGAPEAVNIEASGAITVADSTLFDFESQAVMNWTIEAMKNEQLYHQLNLIVNLTDGDDPPVMADQSFTIDENSSTGTVVGTIVAEDQDSPTLLYAIESGNAGSTFEIQSTNMLVVNDSSLLDFETNPVFQLQISVTDGFFTTSAEFTINVNDLDEGGDPVIDDQSFTVDENSGNGTVVGTIEASDPDGDALSFSLTSGNTNEAFALGASNGELTVNDSAQLDFETTPTFTLVVQVDDGTDRTDQAIITVNLNDLDEGGNPVIDDQSFTVDENSSNGTVVGTIVASDPDGDALSFSLTSGNTNEAFALGASNGELTVNDSAQLDFETTPTFTLVVQVDDGTDRTDQAIITVNLNDLDEGGNPVIDDQSFTVDENSSNGTVVGTIVASDPDGDALSFSLTSGNTNEAFALGASNGELTVNDSAQLDFETTPTFTLVVQVDDGTDRTDQAIITVNLIDVDEGRNPVIDDQSFTVDENSSNGTVVGTIEASDPDGDSLSFSLISGNTNEAFALGDSSGELTVNDSAQLDFETTPTFTLVVRADDGTDRTDQAIITISLIDVVEETGIDGVNLSNKVIVYPNPSSGLISVNTNEFFNNAEYKLYNVNGEMVMEGKAPAANHFTIILPNPSGVYLMKLMKDGEYALLTIIKR